MRFTLRLERRNYILKHFEASSEAGSKFFPQIFSNPEDLVSFINVYPPKEKKRQSPQRMAFVFVHPEQLHLGNSAVTQRKNIDPQNIISQDHNGHKIDIGMVSELPACTTFCVIADEKEDHFEIITTFPGNWAPPFPHAGLKGKDLKESLHFWEENILLKVR